MITKISQSALLQIYGTVHDLQNHCSCAAECWKNIEKLKSGRDQVLYHPFFGPDYKGILFAGINLNGVMSAETAIEDLVDKAKDDLKKKKYKIFKSKYYGGTSFYYYVPLLAYLYHIYTNGHCLIETEQEISEHIVEGFQYCGLTNLIKCSVDSPNRRSTPSTEMYKNCIGKFRQELGSIEYSVLVIFTRYSCPSLPELLGRYTLLDDDKGDRYKIYADGKSRLLELEHPQSTHIKRPAKFISYSHAIYKVVKSLSAGAL